MKYMFSGNISVNIPLKYGNISSLPMGWLMCDKATGEWLKLKMFVSKDYSSDHNV